MLSQVALWPNNKLKCIIFRKRAYLLHKRYTVYIKKVDAVASLMEDAAVGNPYTGAKEHYILDIEDRNLALDAVRALVAVTPIPVKKKKKKAP